MQSYVVIKNSNGEMSSEKYQYPETIQFTSIPVRSANNNELFEYGKSLLEAAGSGNVQRIKSLLEMGAPISTDWLGTSPLHMAAKNGHTAAVEFFLKTGVCRDARNKVDRTPLHFAAQHGYTDIVTLLVKHGTDLDAQDMLKMTPLHWAVENQHQDTVRRLLEFGANTQLENKFLQTPLDISNENLSIDITQILLDAPAIRIAGEEKGMIPNCDGRKSQARIQEVLQQARANSVAKPLQVMYKYLPGGGMVRAELVNNKKSKAQGPIDFSESGDFPELSKLDHLTKESISESAAAVKLLESEGIFVTPEEPNNIVSNAVASGHKVILTAAGRLAMSSTGMEAGSPPVKKQIIPTIRPISNLENRKVVRVTESQLRALNGQNSGKAPMIHKVPRPGYGRIASSIDTSTTAPGGPIISKPNTDHLVKSSNVVYYQRLKTGTVVNGAKPEIRVIQKPQGSQGNKRFQIIPSRKISDVMSSLS
ncbi:GA-binding protein subunit beta-2-like isoform X2 [Artemia franciscana]